MSKITKTLKVINLILIVLIGGIFVFSSGFALFSLFATGVFKMIFGGYLMALIFGVLAFKKDYFLILSLAGWIIFAFSVNADKKEVEKNYKPAGIYFTEDKVDDYLKTHNFCETVSDCSPVITSCKSCSDYGSAINKAYKNKFIDMLLDKCDKDGEGRICDSVPNMPKNKEIKCLDGRCIFVTKE